MQKNTLSKLAFRIVAILAIFGMLVLLGCPSDDDDDDELRPVNNVAVPIEADTVAALNGETFTFTNGVQDDFGTTTATDVQFTTTGGATTANITAGDDTAATAVTFGSCIFDVTTSEFTEGPLATDGEPITVQPCTLIVSATNVPVGGEETDGTAMLRLGDARSEPETISVRLDADGGLFLNGVDTGITVDITGTGTGATGN